VLLLTTLEAWRTEPDAPFVPADGTAAWASEDPESISDTLAMADYLSADGQVIAITLAPASVAQPGVIERSAVARMRFFQRGPDGRHHALLTRSATAEALDLLPHPEGGWFRETWAAPARFRPDGYPGERASATGIYFLLPPEEHSIWHAVRSDELWLWHRGGPLTLLLGGFDDIPHEPEDSPASDTVRMITLGPDVERGQQPQALVPAGVWQAARPAADEEVLVTCVVSPGFDFSDFQTA
jgi:hypothetical protein